MFYAQYVTDMSGIKGFNFRPQNLYTFMIRTGSTSFLFNVNERLDICHVDRD